VPLTYGQLHAKHPEYDADEWARCRALYAGGKKLLKNKAVMDMLFPPHNAETAIVYQERCRRAFIIPYAGQVIDFIVAALFGEQLKVEAPGADPFYAEFVKNVAEPGADELELRKLLNHQIRTALICRRAWTMVELPTAPEEKPLSISDEEKIGQRRAYACAIEPECVTDWKVDARGELLWAKLTYVDSSRLTFDDPGVMVREEHTLYTPEGWTRWKFQYHRDKKPAPEKLLADIEGLETTEGTHSFGKVPLARLELPEGLHAMGKLEGIATEHFNKRNALAWGEYKGLFQFLAFFLEPPKSTDPKTDDLNRATNQTIGPGRAWRGAQNDKVEVISPDTAPFTHALDSLRDLRDEMFRVVHHMALAVDNSGAALKRSGESKKVDKAGEAVVLIALGEITRKLAIGIMQLAARGRGDAGMVWTASGMDAYKDEDLASLIEQELMLETIPIPSPTFQVARKLELVRRHLGERATPELLAKIERELGQLITAESLAPPDPNADPGGDREPKGE